MISEISWIEWSLFLIIVISGGEWLYIKYLKKVFLILGMIELYWIIIFLIEINLFIFVFGNSENSKYFEFYIGDMFSYL